MKWLVVLDPLDRLLERTDTSLAIIRQARAVGITVDTATIHSLYFSDQAMVVANDAFGTEKKEVLASYQCIFMRKEPPYDLSFHYATQLLSLAGTCVVNSPRALRDYNEKLIALNFKDFMPPTLVSSKCKIIGDFLEEYGDCVIKSLDSFQGQSVRRIAREDHEAVRSSTNDGRQPVMVQQFQDRVYEGDKRVLIVAGSLLGAVLRRPKDGYHANFANSEALKTSLSKREQKIVATVGPWLLDRDIHFAGLDLIGEQLTEVNITCPTGIVQISQLEKRNLAEEIVHYFSGLVSK